MKKKFLGWAIVPVIAISGFIAFSSFTDDGEGPGGSNVKCKKTSSPSDYCVKGSGNFVYSCVNNANLITSEC
jgi:hypothetical protein